MVHNGSGSVLQATEAGQHATLLPTLHTTRPLFLQRRMKRRSCCRSLRRRRRRRLLRLPSASRSCPSASPTSGENTASTEPARTAPASFIARPRVMVPSAMLTAKSSKEASSTFLLSIDGPFLWSALPTEHRYQHLQVRMIGSLLYTSLRQPGHLSCEEALRLCAPVSRRVCLYPGTEVILPVCKVCRNSAPSVPRVLLTTIPRPLLLPIALLPLQVHFWAFCAPY
jgi:hypothetical protein